jgi:hypothetical protein
VQEPINIKKRREGKYGLRKIRAMSLEDLKYLERMIYWRRAYHGTVGHAWPEAERTLCDKQLVPHNRHAGWMQSHVCKKCTDREIELRRCLRKLEYARKENAHGSST